MNMKKNNISKNEKWVTIERFPRYMVSNRGRVKRIQIEFWHKGEAHTRFYNEIILKQTDNGGYNAVMLKSSAERKIQKIHRLVAIYFVENPNNYNVVNHKNENKKCNLPENLMWTTPSENCNWGTRNKRISDTNAKREFTSEHRANLSAAAKGNKNRSGAKNSKNHNDAISKAHSKIVYCNGKKYNSMVICAKAINVNYRTFAHWVTGDRQPPKNIKIQLEDSGK